MAAWGWLKYAPWGEIAKAAARVPELMRDLRKPGQGKLEPEMPTGPGTPVPGAEQLQFEIELLKTNVDRLRAHAETQGRAMEQQAKALAENFDAIGRRLRLITWIAGAALVIAIAALIVVLTR